MNTNDIPQELLELLPQREFVSYSFDVTEDGESGVLALCTDDVENPEIWIYEQPTHSVWQADQGILMDFSVSRVFWAENQRDLIVASPDDEPDLQLLTLDETGRLCDEVSPIHNDSDYIRHKLATVDDFTRPDLRENQATPEEASGQDDFLKDFGGALLESIRRKHAISEFSQDGQAYWSKYETIYGEVVLLLKENAEKHGVPMPITADDLRAAAGSEGYLGQIADVLVQTQS